MPGRKEKSYYGPFFWLAATSFVVPIVVAGAAFKSLPKPHTKPRPNPDASGVDHALWDYLLKAYVQNGLVDYQGMKRDYLFKTYLRQLGEADPKKLARDADRLALYCNAYNAFVVDGVITHKIKDTVAAYKRDGKGFFDLTEHILAAETMSLNHLEHKLIRPTFKDPRVHMALVCAAKGCPAIRPEAFVGGRIERQLEDQARRFANHTGHVRYDPETKTLHLSPILQWYVRDFDAGGGVLKFLAKRVKDPALKAATERAIKKKVKVVFDKYDWRLNAQQSGTGGSGAGKTVDFGSGSIPNE